MSTDVDTDDSPTILRENWYKKNMDVTGKQAATLFETFTTDQQLLDACEGGEDLTEYEGIGKKTADEVWHWYQNIYGETVEVDGTLELNDDGLETPDWLVGHQGKVTVETPTVTMEAGVSGLSERNGLILSYPSGGPETERLSDGQIAISARGYEERIYEIDDQRTEDNA